MEKRKKDEEEFKEQEAKKKKEIFSMQQAALLEEYKQTVTAEKKIKHGKKTGLTDQGSEHFENIQAAGQASKPIQLSHIYQHNEKPTINSNSNTNNTVYAQYAGQTNPTVVTTDPDINTGSNFAIGS
jgi:anthranilate/para-aminobenzoate synthase component II